MQGVHSRSDEPGRRSGRGRRSPQGLCQPGGGAVSCVEREPGTGNRERVRYGSQFPDPGSRFRMTASELRQRFLDFFKEKGHAIIPSASLIPENDPSVLFTTAGMQPLVQYLQGQPHPMGERIANVQKCLRTDDIDEVGDNRHLTFFEMLGNWSLGDYFKQEAIGWSFEFLT